MNKKLKEVCQRLVDEYVMNKNRDSEFIACVTPSRRTIGTGGVWDDWKILDGLLNDPDPICPLLQTGVYRSTRTQMVFLCMDPDAKLFWSFNTGRFINIHHDQLVLVVKKI